MKQDKTLGGILLVFCAAYGYLTATMQRTTVAGTPDQAFLPTIYVVGLAALALTLLLRKPKTQAVVEGEREDEENAPPTESLWAALKIFLIIFLYYVMIPTLGFVVGTLIGVFIFVKQTIKSNKVCALTAIFSAVVLYVIFKVIFKIQLPAGWLI